MLGKDPARRACLLVGNQQVRIVHGPQAAIVVVANDQGQALDHHDIYPRPLKGGNGITGSAGKQIIFRPGMLLQAFEPGKQRSIDSLHAQPFVKLWHQPYGVKAHAFDVRPREPRNSFVTGIGTRLQGCSQDLSLLFQRQRSGCEALFNLNQHKTLAPRYSD